jgi:hypothetical protein
MRAHAAATTVVTCLLLAACAGAAPSSPGPPAATATATAGGTTSPPTARPSPTPRTEPYLGERVPGANPVRFAARVIYGELHTAPVFMPDGSEIYWSDQSPQILMVRLEGDGWTAPVPVSIGSSLTDFRDPFISPGGERIYFFSTDPLPGGGPSEKENIWYAERDGAGWGEPVPVAASINALRTHWQVSVTADLDLYFSAAQEGAEMVGRIMVSRWVDGGYADPVPLGPPVDTDEMELTPYIAPDESYLLFSRVADPRSTPNLYVTYREGADRWSEPVRVEHVAYALCPVVSPDGRYLFYMGGSHAIYWMTTEVIRDLKPQ